MNKHILFIQGAGDDVVPFNHFILYKKNIPWAISREMAHGGHQLNNDLTQVANDIKSL
jgi:uncharacterized protein